MKKLTNLFLMTAIALLAITGCTPKNEVEEPTLTVDKQEVLFTNAGGEAKVTITTNQEKWTPIVAEGAKWISITASGSTLTIKATENNTDEDREGAVLAMAGGLPVRITVKQSQADVVLSFNPEEVFVPTKGGNIIVDVTSNSSRWALDPLPSDVTWLRIKGSGKSNLIVIEADANTGFETREAEVIAIAPNGDKKIIPVSQAGVQKYYMPYVTTEFDITKLVRFEAKRGSVVQILSDPSEFFGQSYPGQYVFILPNENQPIMAYEIGKNAPAFSKMQTIIYFEDGKNPVEIKEYSEFLVNNGYAKKESSAENLLKFYNKDTHYEVTVKVYPELGLEISFTEKYEQTQPLPTWSTLPMGPEGAISMINDPKKKVADVDALEAALGSTPNPELVSMGKVRPEDFHMKGYNTGKEGKDEFLRIWFFVTPENAGEPVTDLNQSVAEFSLFFSDQALIGYQGGSKFYLSNEFLALTAKEGFTFVREAQAGTFLFSKPHTETRTLYLVARAAAFKDIMDGAPIVQMAYFQQENQGTDGAALLKKVRRNKYTKEDLFPTINFPSKNFLK